MSEIFEINYSPEQIEYWTKSYRRRMESLRASIDNIDDTDDEKIVQTFQDIFFIFHQIRCHLICNAEFLSKLEEKMKI